MTNDDRKRIEGVIPMVWRAARRDVGSVRMHAEDIASEYFLALAESIHRYNPEFAYTTFATWIMRGRRVRLIRKQMQSVGYEYRKFTDKEDGLLDFDEPVTDDVLAIAQQGLSSRDKQLVELRYYHGMGQEALAAHLGVRRQVVVRRLRRATQRMRKNVTLRELADAADAGTTRTGDDLLPDGVATR